MKNSIEFYKKIYDPSLKKNHTRCGDRSRVALRAFERHCDRNNVVISSVIDAGCVWGKCISYGS